MTRTELEERVEELEQQVQEKDELIVSQSATITEFGQQAIQFAAMQGQVQELNFQIGNLNQAIANHEVIGVYSRFAVGWIVSSIGQRSFAETINQSELMLGIRDKDPQMIQSGVASILAAFEGFDLPVSEAESSELSILLADFI